MIQESQDLIKDGELLSGYTFTDLDQTTLNRYRRLFEVYNPHHNYNEMDDKSFLINLGAITTDRKTGEEWLTKAGLLMFGTGLAIRERFDNIRLEYIDRRLNVIDGKYRDRLSYDGSWENNLFNYFDILTKKMLADLPIPFKLEGITRVDDSDLKKSLREAALNMIVHSDCELNGILKAEKIELGYFFTNPGTLMLPLEYVCLDDISKVRNPRIQRMFRLIGFGENLGSGIPFIFNTWNSENWRLPKLKQDKNLRQIKLSLWTQSITSNEIREVLESFYKEEYSRLSELEKNILSILLIEKKVSLERLNVLLMDSKQDIINALDNLSDKLLTRENKNPLETEYKLNLNYKENKAKPAFWDKKEKEIYNCLKDHGPMNRYEVMENVGFKSRHAITKRLNKLIERDLVEKEKIGRSNYFKIKKD